MWTRNKRDSPIRANQNIKQNVSGGLSFLSLEGAGERDRRYVKARQSANAAGHACDRKRRPLRRPGDIRGQGLRENAPCYQLRLAIRSAGRYPWFGKDACPRGCAAL